jgi:cell pole-organizing protein PopZ
MASNPQHEPTMEEILASIRKIISEDSNEAAPVPAAAPAAAARPAPVEDDGDVLELTQEVPHEEPARPAPVAAPAPVAPAPEPVKLAAVPPAPRPIEQDVVFQSVEEAAVSSSAADDIFSEKTRKAVDEVFSNIDAEPEPAPRTRAAAPSLSPVDGASIEAVFERAVRESFEPLLQQWMDGRKDELLAAVKPMIREWMDDHFPALLEGAVRNEVARVVKARGR